MKFYKSYKTEASIDQSQLAFSSFTESVDLDVENSAAPVPQQLTKSYNYHTGYPMVYDFTVSTTKGSYAGRNLDAMIIRFTEGIDKI